MVSELPPIAALLWAAGAILALVGASMLSRVLLVAGVAASFWRRSSACPPEVRRSSFRSSSSASRSPSASIRRVCGLWVSASCPPGSLARSPRPRCVARLAGYSEPQ